MSSDIKEIIGRAREAENAMSDAEWDDMANLRSATNAGLSRPVDPVNCTEKPPTNVQHFVLC